MHYSKVQIKHCPKNLTVHNFGRCFVRLPYRPVRPVDDIEHEEHEGEKVEKETVNFGQFLRLLNAGNLLFPFVHLGALKMRQCKNLHTKKRKMCFIIF